MKTLVVYYSLEGNTEYAAQMIAKYLDADLLMLEPVKDYPEGSAAKFIYGGAAVLFGRDPELRKYSKDIKEYDMVIMGTPVWAGRPAPPLNTFLKEKSLKTKKTALFASSGSGNADKCFRKMREKLKNVSASVSFKNPLANREEAKKKVEEFVSQIKQVME